jgi:hypothetical protein
MTTILVGRTFLVDALAILVEGNVMEVIVSVSSDRTIITVTSRIPSLHINLILM